MPEPSLNIDFATVLASTVHDMKNSLCMLIQSTELIQQEAENCLSDNARAELAQLNYEANRLNGNLLKLLSLYRLEKNQLPIQVDEYYLSDIIEEITLKHHYYSEQRNISVSVEQAGDISWFFDHALITNLLSDVFANALRYCKQQIILKIYTENNQLIIEIHDDGEGFPENMLHNSQAAMQEINFKNSHTGLGVFFARLIAAAHKNHGKTGSVSLRNGGLLSGGVFTLVIP